jgi:hypothetical protein
MQKKKKPNKLTIFFLKNELIKFYLSKTNVGFIHLKYDYLIGQ